MYYENQARALLAIYGKDIAQFTFGLDQLVQEGERLLSLCQATGYNIIHTREDMDIPNVKWLIFYSHAIYLPHHFGSLLTTMEHESIIHKNQVRFGVRSSTVLTTGWDTDADKRTIIRRCQRGKIDTLSVLDFVETVITFSPENKDQARQIADFLDRRTRRGRPDAIVDSPAIPDIRATLSLEDVLPQDRFTLARANIFHIGETQLIVLRQRRHLGHQSWINVPVVLNKDLVGYLTHFGVGN